MNGNRYRMPARDSALTRLKNSFARLPRVVQILIYLQAGLYLLLVILGDEAATLVPWIALAPGEVLAGRVWTLLTYLPFHYGRDPLGAIFDIVVLWSLGGMFGHRWRQTHFLFFYLVGGVGGGLLDLVLYLIFPDAFGAPVLGASGASFALFAAFLMIFGEQQVSVFGSTPFKGKWVFWALLGLETVFFIAGTNPAYGVQLGGVVTGWLLVTGRWRPGKAKRYATDMGGRLRRWQHERKKRRFRVVN